MKQVLIKEGAVFVEEVPAPQIEPGFVLVRVDHSCISVGTEVSGVKTSGLPLWKRALKEPQKVKNMLSIVATQGISYTRNLVQSKMASTFATGYSAAGTVIEVGPGVDDLTPGDRVACAGAQCAHHAEYICVPRNLTVLLPENLDFASASTVTVGAIALQGVRRASPTLGESFVVIGMGLLGQLTAQLLKANGCRVIGVDLDRKRLDLALSLGMDVAVHPDDGDDVQTVARLTDGIGADSVIITASTPSDAVLSTAFKMCRKKGRVVLVGDVGLNLNRLDFYFKEIDFYISCSYGPGRYDYNFEEKGLDYPVAYVRWTETRNMAEYLHLLSTEQVRIKPLIAATHPVSEAAAAYEQLKTTVNTAPMVLLSYPKAGPDPRLVRSIPNPVSTSAGKSGQVRLALVGAGEFAKTTHLPNLKDLANLYHLRSVMGRRGFNATAIAKQFGFAVSTTDYQEVLKDAEVDAVLICTRHHLHTDMALEALNAGKHVLVEKPLALTHDELVKIQAFYEKHPGGPVLLTGFNRRFSPIARKLKELTKARTNPMILTYRMNAGYLPLDHWVHSDEGGGRNIGEACHIYDLFTYLTDARVVDVTAAGINPKTGYYSARDNFSATIRFDDGSVANLIYTALGSSSYPKEKLDVFVDGKVLSMDNYLELAVVGAKDKGYKSRIVDKGHKEELSDFARVVQNGGEWPIPLWQQIQASEIALQVESFLKKG